MPYLHVSIGKALDGAQVDALRRSLEQMVTILPGKNADNCMIHIDAGCDMFMHGEKSPCVYAEVRLYRASPADKKAAFAAAFAELMQREYGIPTGLVYMNLLEMDHWYAGGSAL